MLTKESLQSKLQNGLSVGLENKLTFPRTKFVTSNGLLEQLRHVRSELNEVLDAYIDESAERIAEELIDLYHSTETALRIIDEQLCDVSAIMERVAEKNLRRGYYAD